MTLLDASKLKAWSDFCSNFQGVAHRRSQSMLVQTIMLLVDILDVRSICTAVVLVLYFCHGEDLIVQVETGHKEPAASP